MYVVLHFVHVVHFVASALREVQQRRTNQVQTQSAATTNDVQQQKHRHGVQHNVAALRCSSSSPLFRRVALFFQLFAIVLRPSSFVVVSLLVCFGVGVVAACGFRERW